MSYKKEILFTVFFSLMMITAMAQDSTGIKKKNINYAVIPLLSFNLSKGFGLGVVSSAFYNVNKKDTISPASATALIVSYSTNGSWYALIGQNLYLDNDNWRLQFGIGHMNNNFQTVSSAPGSEDVVIPFNTSANFVSLKVLRRVYNRFYAGPNMQLAGGKTEFDIPNATPNSFKQNTFGIDALNDTRNNIYNSSKGAQISFSAMFFTKAWGNELPYTRITAFANYYHIIAPKHILAARIFAKAALGNSIPFEGESTIGSKDIRGYSSGKYRDAQVYALQGEDRWNFKDKWGAVFFAGIAVTNSAKNGFSSLLPAIGTGIRYKAIPTRNINIGIDVAAGKDDWGLYFRINEAF